MSTQQPAGTIRMIAPGTLTDAVFSPDSSLIYTARGGTITSYNVATGAQVGSWAIGRTLGGIDISRDGRTVVATERQAGPSVTTNGMTSTDYYVYALNTTSGSLRTFSATQTGYSTEFFDVSFLSDGKALLSQASYWEPLTTLDLASGTFAETSQTFAQAPVLTATADRSHVLLGPQNISDAPMYVYTAGSGVTARHDGYADNVMGFNNGVQAISPTGNFVFQRGLNLYDGDLHFITTLSNRYNELGSVAGAAFDQAGANLYLLDVTSKLIVQMETTHWGVVRSFSTETDIGPAGGSYGNVLQLSPDGRTLSVIGSAGLEVITLSSVVANGPSDAADSITGSAFSDTLYGFGGNDTISGGAGADVMWGGSGDDTYYVDNIGDQVLEFTDGGQDTVYSSVNYYLSGGVETLILTGGAIFASGTDNGDTIVGNDGNNSIYGNGGNDVLSGGAGTDVLDGGSGDDTIDGGAGNDVIYSGAGNDMVTGGAGADIFGGGLSSLSGDTITDLGPGDRIQIYEADYATFEYDRAGAILKIGTSPINIGSPNVRLVVAENTEIRGVDLVGANRMTGLTDFDGDGHSDILWRHSNGALSTWEVTGNVAGSHLQPSVFNSWTDPSWKALETLDFNGDGVSDILWRNTNGSTSIWTGTGHGDFTVGYNDSSVSNRSALAATGDFDGDGKDDLVWRDDDGSIAIWKSTGTGYVQKAYTHDSVGTSWKVDGAGDFDGDGKADLLWRNDNGAISIWHSTGADFTVPFNGNPGSDWKVAATADFDGDGRADILWRHSNGALSNWSSTGNGFAVTYNDTSVGNDWRVATVGDFNDDGKADILWQHSSGYISTWESNGAGFNQNVASAGVDAGWSVIGHHFPL